MVRAGRGIAKGKMRKKWRALVILMVVVMSLPADDLDSWRISGGGRRAQQKTKAEFEETAAVRFVPGKSRT